MRKSPAKTSDKKIESVQPVAVLDSPVPSSPKKPRYARKLLKFQRALERDPLASPTDLAYKIYKCKNRNSASAIGGQNLRKLGISMAEIFDRKGMDDEALAVALVAKTKAKETKFFQHEGVVVETRQVEAHEIQLKALDIIAVLKGKKQTREDRENNDNLLVLIGSINVNNDRPVGEIVKDFTSKLSAASGR